MTGSITLPEGVEMCMPGDNVKVTVELMEGMPVAMDEGLRFAIREGGRTVGSGVVTKIHRPEQWSVVSGSVVSQTVDAARCRRGRRPCRLTDH